MIYYAKDHIEGASKLAVKYELTPCKPEDYVHQDKLFSYFPEDKQQKLFDVVSKHRDIHAYVLDDLVMHFHPMCITPVITRAYEKFFNQII